MAFHLITSNRLEELAKHCCQIFKEDPLPPMCPELIVVQSIGMRQWFSTQMSRELGVWSNFDYLFPNRLTSLIIKSFYRDIPDERFFDKDIFTWKVMKFLREHRNDNLYKEIISYIDGDDKNIREYQISYRIADTMDQYITFRPDMILRWGKGNISQDEKWQGNLWKEITANMAVKNPALLLKEIFDSLLDNSARVEDFPKRITCFGISYLPLFHLNLLRAASFFCDVYFYMLNPCKEEWMNLSTEKEISNIYRRESEKYARKLITGEDFEELQHIDRGNSLLASWGRSGRDFLNFLYISSQELVLKEYFDDFESFVNLTLLHKIQQDILFMANRRELNDNHQEEIKADSSITINSCYSPMREMEVLRDYILDLFNNNHDLAPQDIVVMTPDIESYSGYIQGVFGATEEGIPLIPFSIIDRKLISESPVITAFFKILSIDDSRFSASEVLSLLMYEPIAMKFNFSSDDVEKISLWVRESNIFWGIDEKYKEDHGLAALRENTWVYGVERMLLGTMMSHGDELVFDILPYSAIEGGEREVLGRFIFFLDRLFYFYKKTQGSFTLALWAEIIGEIISTFFDEEKFYNDIRPLREAIEKLLAISNESGFDEEITIYPVMEYLKSFTATERGGKNFITGHVTFCEMLPMRSIPAKVICLVGMNEYSFPRKSKPLSFDLISLKPRRGDRNIRDEDRYLFLETVISARENLYISFVGQDIVTGKEYNPSVVVSELIEYIEKNYITADRISPLNYIFTKHKLQAYHPEYFLSENKVFTYSLLRKKEAQSFLGKRINEVFFESLPPLTDEEKNINVDDLVVFLSNPAEYVLKKRLGVKLDINISEIKDEEDFSPDNIATYNIKSSIQELRLRNFDKERIFKFLAKSGNLPQASLARGFYEKNYLSVESLLRKIDISGHKSQEAVSRTIGDINISAKYTLYGERQIFFRVGKLRPKDILKAWIYHLIVSTVKDNVSTSFVAEDKSISFKGNEFDEKKSAFDIIKDLLDIYIIGMESPVPLFPESSGNFVSQYIEKHDENKALASAISNFKNDYNKSGDAFNPYVRKVFGDSYTLDEDFIRYAKIVYEIPYRIKEEF